MAALQRFKRDLNLCFSIFKRNCGDSALFQRAAAAGFQKNRGKNLSQSYGRWIVGFHEPMTSALFAFKKGAKDWRYDMKWSCGKPAPFFRRADCCD